MLIRLIYVFATTFLLLTESAASDSRNIYGLDNPKNFRRANYSALTQINLSESAKEIPTFPTKSDKRTLSSVDGQEVDAKIHFVHLSKNIAEIQIDSKKYDTNMELFNEPTKELLREWQAKNSITHSNLAVTRHMQSRSTEHEHGPFKINQPLLRNISFDSFYTREYYVSFLLGPKPDSDLKEVTAYIGIRVRRSFPDASGYSSSTSRYAKKDLVGFYMMYKTIPNIHIQANQETELFSEKFLLTSGAGTTDSITDYYLILEHKGEVILTALSSKILTDYAKFHMKSVHEGTPLPKYDRERR